MAPSILTSHPTLRIVPEPLTPDAFALFGTAICSPLPRDLSSPHPVTSLPPHNPPPVVANQSSALKYSPISPLLDRYPGQCPSGHASAARMSMFSCFPRQLRLTPSSDGSPTPVFDINILERHPFTTQTFTPIDLSSQITAGDKEEPLFLVIVAQTLKGHTVSAKTSTGATVTIRDPPDLNNLRAFIAHGGQAVTYGVGTWHSPMVVLGSRRVDFVVVQFVNGVEEEDVQEVEFGEGIVVDLGSGGRVSTRGSRL